eukprot:359625_1
MGNSRSKRNQNKNSTSKDDQYIEYKIVPTNMKFSKIDLIKYGKVFTNYKSRDIADNMQTINIISALELESKQNSHAATTATNCYFDESFRRNVIEKCKPYQFPLDSILSFCVTYQQYELLEFILTQELIETLYWSRDYFKCNLYSIIKWSSQLMKLTALNVIASYMIPERIEQSEFKILITDAHKSRKFHSSSSGYFHGSYELSMYNSESEKQRFEALCNGMVEVGMHNRAQRIVQTRKELINKSQFPNELIGIIIGYAFGMSHKSDKHE